MKVFLLLFLQKKKSFLSFSDLQAALAIAAGAVLLAWPALLNGFPIVFSDTHAFLVQAGEPQMVWDKPFIYGPFLRALHGRITLWLPLAGQLLILSHLLWRARAAFAPPTPVFHVALCAGLAMFSAAPWFASLLMPDIMAPIAVLCLFLLGFSSGRRAWLLALGDFAIASHLAYLPMAALVTLLALWRGARRIVLAPLAIALALLLATNAVGNGRFAISPFGSVFALARLVTDGPAQAVLARECPAAGWRMCAWQGRFPPESDLFLWDPDGPVWTTRGGPKALAPEASAIVRATVMAEPLAVLRTGLANAAEQLVRVRLGDILGSENLEGSIVGSFNAYFPPAELARFRAARQLNDRLRAIAEPLNPPHIGVLLLGAAATLWVAWRHRARPAGVLALLVIAGVLANAAASGALSRPHDRYQARIAWLVLLPPLLTLRAARPAPAPPRTPASAP